MDKNVVQPTTLNELVEMQENMLNTMEEASALEFAGETIGMVIVGKLTDNLKEAYDLGVKAVEQKQPHVLPIHLN